jgi:hypothetical protein
LDSNLASCKVLTFLELGKAFELNYKVWRWFEFLEKDLYEIWARLNATVPGSKTDRAWRAFTQQLLIMTAPTVVMSSPPPPVDSDHAPRFGAPWQHRPYSLLQAIDKAKPHFALSPSHSLLLALLLAITDEPESSRWVLHFRALEVLPEPCSDPCHRPSRPEAITAFSLGVERPTSASLLWLSSGQAVAVVSFVLTPCTSLTAQARISAAPSAAHNCSLPVVPRHHRNTPFSEPSPPRHLETISLSPWTALAPFPLHPVPPAHRETSCRDRPVAMAPPNLCPIWGWQPNSVWAGQRWPIGTVCLVNFPMDLFESSSN